MLVFTVESRADFLPGALGAGAEAPRAFAVREPEPRPRRGANHLRLSTCAALTWAVLRFTGTLLIRGETGDCEEIRGFIGLHQERGESVCETTGKARRQRSREKSLVHLGLSPAGTVAHKGLFPSGAPRSSAQWASRGSRAFTPRRDAQGDGSPHTRLVS